jgi:hypothetical protein
VTAVGTRYDPELEEPMAPDTSPPDGAEPDAGSSGKAAPKRQARRRTPSTDAAPPEHEDAGRRVLSRAEQAELRRKLREKFH